MRNLMLAEYLGKMSREGRWYNGNPQDWRESILIEGMMWQRTRKMICHELAPLTEALLEMQQALEGSLAELGEVVRQGGMLSVPTCANVLMEMMAELMMGWCLGETAYSARTLADPVIHEGKLATARYFMSTVLPLSRAKAQQVSYLIQTDSVANAAFSWNIADA
ncbi:TPA: acyl-CoA dehydrogenase C-terminal domain-containing protein [Salmonella enterica subsp. enterica serovar Java]|nr:acyl-CoA dehydrogenase C-terminal domain-containing protein [Salmonella enterica subsp. enterica serovar Java]